MTPDELNGSMTMKFINYKLEPGIMDPENPLSKGKFGFLTSI
jgi:hypothetical protein